MLTKIFIFLCSGHVANRWRFRVGSTWANSGGVVHSVSSIINHPSYNRNTWDNDIAILRSASTIGFNNNVRAVSIAGSNYNLADNQVVWAAGWGLTSVSLFVSSVFFTETFLGIMLMI